MNQALQQTWPCDRVVAGDRLTPVATGAVARLLNAFSSAAEGIGCGVAHPYGRG